MITSKALIILRVAALLVMVLALAALLAPTDLIEARGAMLQGVIGTYSGDGTATLHVHWTSDSTTSPATERCSTSGTVGGTPIIRIRFQAPSDTYSATVEELRIHESYSHTASEMADEVYTEIPFDGWPQPACGDPDSSIPGSPRMMYASYWWYGCLQRHNGPHVITARIRCQTYNYDSATGSYTSSTSYVSQNITVDIQNILIQDTTPHNPDPIIWNPSTMSSVPLSATLTAASRGSRKVKWTIYGTNQVSLKTLETTVPVGGSSATTVNVSWDGTLDSASFGPPSPTPTKAPAGIYLFKVVATSENVYPYLDSDCDKSSFVAISPKASDPQAQVSGTNYVSSFDLSSVYGKAASRGEVRLYSPFQGLVGQSALLASDLTPGSHLARVQAATQPFGALPYVMLIGVGDSHPAFDRNHRVRDALQLNPNLRLKTAALLCFRYVDKGDTQQGAKAAWDLLQDGYYSPGGLQVVKYGKAPLRISAGPANNPRDYENLKESDFPQEPILNTDAGRAIWSLWWKPNVWMYYGHGMGGKLQGKALKLYSNPIGNRTETLLITDDSLRPSGFNSTNCKALNSAFAPGELNGVELAIILACYSGSSPADPSGNTGSLEETLRRKGVANTISFRSILPLDMARFFSDAFWNYYLRGSIDGQVMPRKGMDIKAAAHDTVEKFRGRLFYGNGEDREGIVRFNGELLK